MSKKKTHEEFVKEVFSLVGNEYSVLGTYKGVRFKVKIKHNLCGYEYDIFPNGFTIKGNRCANCSDKRTRKLTHEEFLQRVKDTVGEEYSVIGIYKKGSVPIEIKHNTCGHSWNIRPNNFIHHGHRCPKCTSERLTKLKTKNHDQFVNEVFQIFGDEYTVIGKYTHNKNHIKVIHNKCGNTYDAQPNALLRGHGCKKCADKIRGFKNRKPYEVLKNEVYEKGNGEYVLIGDYDGDNKHILVKHLTCSHEYLVTPSNFLSGYRCPACNESKGERKIREYIQDKMNFQSQYKFSDLLGRNGFPLKFDFAIFKRQNKLMFLIEYDGEYHYYPIVSEWHLAYQKEHDNLKNLYCKDNNIPLLRIPYWEKDNIETIIFRYCKNFKEIEGELNE